jgi:hypothetical protein
MPANQLSRIDKIKPIDEKGSLMPSSGLDVSRRILAKLIKIKTHGTN